MKTRMTAMVLGGALLAACGGGKAERKPDQGAATKPELTRPAEPKASEPAQPQPPPKPVVVLRPDPHAPVVSVRLLFRAGSVDDPAGQEGITDMLASLMSEATEKLDASELSRALYPYATGISTQVDAEVTVFKMTVHKEVAARAIPLLFDVVASPRMDARDFERLRQTAITSIQQDLREAHDEALGDSAFNTLLWQGHPYGHMESGTVQALKSMTLDQLKTHRLKVFNQARLMAGLGGGYDTETERIFHERMAHLPVGEAWEPVKLPPPVMPKGVQVYIVQKETVSTPINMGFPFALTRTHPDFPLMVVANSAFGEHRQMNGRLFQRMREMRGMNYGDYSYIEHFAQEGWDTIPLVNIPRRQHAFTVWIRPVEQEDAPFALRQVLFELKRLVDEGVTETELEATRNYLQGYTRIWEQGTSRKLGYAMDDIINGTPNHLPTLRERLKTMTRDEVNGAIKRHLQPDNMVVVLMAKDAQKLKDTLLSGAPTPRSPEKTNALPPAEQEVDRLVSTYNLKLTAEQVTVVPVQELFEK